MKNVLLALLVLALTSSFAMGAEYASDCEGRGQEEIDTYREIVLMEIALGEIDNGLRALFMQGLGEMQKDNDYEMQTAREKEWARALEGIAEGFASGALDADLADIFLEKSSSLTTN